MRGLTERTKPEGITTKGVTVQYEQTNEPDEFRYFDFDFLIEMAQGLTEGHNKYPSEGWRDIPAKEHAARAMRHITHYLAGDESEAHIIHAVMRLMFAWANDKGEVI